MTTTRAMAARASITTTGPVAIAFTSVSSAALT
jgi:hypothetical protein